MGLDEVRPCLDGETKSSLNEPNIRWLSTRFDMEAAELQKSFEAQKLFNSSAPFVETAGYLP
jgi:hypothetical protein